MINMVSFEIKKLHGHFSLKVPFVDNRLVLVGENGTGKSTFVFMLHLTLSKQWHKFDAISFEEITLCINDKTFTFSKELISDFVNSRRKKVGKYPQRIIMEIDTIIGGLGLNISKALNNAEYYEMIQKQGSVRVPYSIYNQIIKDLQSINQSSDKKLISIVTYENYLDEFLDFKVIFLPTYRRIEKEIENIFPDYDEDYRDRFIGRFANRKGASKLELVEFGMVDITKLVAEKMAHLSKQFRTNLQNMTTEYLLDVLSAKYNEIDPKTINFESFGQLESMLDRIGGEILPEQEKSSLKDKISKIKDKGTVDAEDKIILDFILKIVNLQKEQSVIEKELEQFIVVSNKYLVNKKIEYDNRNFEINIEDITTGCKIELNYLSSGEKQVVSIFAHLFLSPSNRYLLIFDEPELSLSVPWQKSFLEDISQSEQCMGVIAVTHSPFIYDNSLVSYSHSINEFITVN